MVSCAMPFTRRNIFIAVIILAVIAALFILLVYNPGKTFASNGQSPQKTGPVTTPAEAQEAVSDTGKGLQDASQELDKLDSILK